MIVFMDSKSRMSEGKHMAVSPALAKVKEIWSEAYSTGTYSLRFLWPA